jgi:hypothetical protein
MLDERGFDNLRSFEREELDGNWPSHLRLWLLCLFGSRVQCRSRNRMIGLDTAVLHRVIERDRAKHVAMGPSWHTPASPVLQFGLKEA